MQEKYLPIGTICKLKEGSKAVAIIGYEVSSLENQTMRFDYCGCLYPEGIISSDVNFAFNHTDIEEIIYLGYKNDEYEKFNKELTEEINSLKNAEVTDNQTNDNQIIDVSKPVIEIPSEDDNK